MFVLHKMVNTAKLNGDLNVNSNSMHNISSNSKCVESVDATYEEGKQWANFNFIPWYVRLGLLLEK